MGKQKNNISQKELLKLQEQAAYNALVKFQEKLVKEANEEKGEVQATSQENVIVTFISLLLYFFGGVIWLVAIIGMGMNCYRICNSYSSQDIMSFAIFLLLLFVSDLLIISGTRFSQEKDSQKIYSFATIIMAIFSFIAAIIAIIV